MKGLREGSLSFDEFYRAIRRPFEGIQQVESTFVDFSYYHLGEGVFCFRERVREPDYEDIISEMGVDRREAYDLIEDEIIRLQEELSEDLESIVEDVYNEDEVEWQTIELDKLYVCLVIIPIRNIERFVASIDVLREKLFSKAPALLDAPIGAEEEKVIMTNAEDYLGFAYSDLSDIVRYIYGECELASIVVNSIKEVIADYAATINSEEYFRKVLKQIK